MFFLSKARIIFRTRETSKYQKNPYLVNKTHISEPRILEVNKLIQSKLEMPENF